MRAGRSPAQSSLVLGVALALATHASPVVARARGIALDSCSGCHGGGAIDAPQLSMTADPPSFDPGDLVTLSLGIRWPAIRVGGAYVSSAGVGTLQPLSGEGLATNGAGLSHSAPKAAANGAVTFRFAWRAPPTPGAVGFDVAAIAGNGNNASSGDSPGNASFQWVFGCAGRTFYLDLDRDGYGSKTLGSRLACAEASTPIGYAALEGDCDENDERAHPGATEVCNKKDDDCNGQVDEGAPPVAMWPDGDGDGFYKLQSGAMKSGCGNVPGYAALGGDCDDLDASIFPGATETCNNKDDNCSGEADERARPQCGIGWCSRYSSSCDPAACRPGPPAAETCNSLDDDCDGIVDNDACAAGFFCSSGQCIPTDDTSGVAGQPGSVMMTPGAPAPSPPESIPSRRAADCSSGGGSAPRRSDTWLLATLLVSAGALTRGRRR